ncbi:hypothetical protein [Caballeronia zhejiangensis]|uniref:hypothetical protein n=1 Tax=Caballeronia zhejiangensis TaxID=871203 RepID=UPI001FD4D808|nr:hypothetical protein [Caballeronia zhejiangensis]
MQTLQETYAKRSINLQALLIGEIGGFDGAEQEIALCRLPSEQSSAPTSVDGTPIISILFGRKSDLTVVTSLGDFRTGQVDVNDCKGEAARQQRMYHDVVLMISDLDQACHGDSSSR